MIIPASKMLVKEIAQLCENFNIGVFSTATPSLRNIYVGELPASVVVAGVDTPISEALWLVESISPPPHVYVDTEYAIIDFWSVSPKTDRSRAILETVFNNFHRRYDYDTANWHIYFSSALGTIVDVDRDANNGKLYRLSVQFICRNLNNIS